MADTINFELHQTVDRHESGLDDLIECLRGDLAEIRDHDHAPLSPGDAAIVDAAWHWARSDLVHPTVANLGSVRFYSTEIRRIRNLLFGQHPNPLGLHRVQ